MGQTDGFIHQWHGQDFGVAQFLHAWFAGHQQSRLLSLFGSHLLTIANSLA